MIAVNLRDSTEQSRIVTRAIAKAVDDLRSRNANIFWRPGRGMHLEMSQQTFEAIVGAAEFVGRTPFLAPLALIGMGIQIDPTLPFGQVRVVDNETLNFETIEVQ